MPKKVSIRPQATEDLYGQALYLAADNPEIARRYVFTVEQSIASLPLTPSVGSTYRAKSIKLKGLRRLIVPGFKNYLIFYIETAKTIEVLRILHGARDIPNLLREGDETASGMAE